MELLVFLKEYWGIITFVIGQIAALLIFAHNINESMKCSLRNDILDIYDRCKEKKEITHYQLQSIKHSYDRYKKLHGNSFVDEIVLERIKEFKLID